jgi:DNA-binding transcriptional ArsR family regulator
MAALADQVDESKHGNWCYPSLLTIQDRTEMGRRTVLRALAKLKEAGWITIRTRPGYGNAYYFDLEKLKTAQRADKRDRCLVGTRAFTAPVPLATLRGALNDAEGCLERLPNKEEPAVNQQEPMANPPLLFFEEKTQRIQTPPISASTVAKDVVTELCLGGPSLLKVLETVAKGELKSGRNPAELREAMIAAWREYDTSQPQMTKYTKRPVNFFGDGDWRNKAKWPWKEGKQPAAGRVYVNS